MKLPFLRNSGQFLKQSNTPFGEIFFTFRCSVSLGCIVLLSRHAAARHRNLREQMVIDYHESGKQRGLPKLIVLALVSMYSFAL